MDEPFKPLVDLCKARKIAMRIGTNHGSLSDRIMNRFGDTPAGMVESAVEFARIARKYGYHDFIFSMKSSNPKVMINAYRLLAARLLELGDVFRYFVIEKESITKTAPADGKALDFLANAHAPHLVTIADGCTLSPIVAYRYLAAQIPAKHPILLKDTFHPPAPGTHTDVLETMLNASANIGALLCDGIGDAILVRGEPYPGASVRLAFNILQSVGNRIFKTDYVACPSCGRTLFNLQTTTAKIRESTNHLKGVKIAIMGCIVNGPGEMADADFGYVGGAPGKVNLYIGKTPVKFNIPEGEAVDRLVDLIKENGKWFEAPVPVAAN